MMFYAGVALMLSRGGVSKATVVSVVSVLQEVTLHVPSIDTDTLRQSLRSLAQVSLEGFGFQSSLRLVFAPVRKCA